MGVCSVELVRVRDGEGARRGGRRCVMCVGCCMRRGCRLSSWRRRAGWGCRPLVEFNVGFGVVVDVGVLGGLDSVSRLEFGSCKGSAVGRLKFQSQDTISRPEKIIVNEALKRKEKKRQPLSYRGPNPQQVSVSIRGYMHATQLTIEPTVVGLVEMWVPKQDRKGYLWKLGPTSPDHEITSGQQQPSKGSTWVYGIEMSVY